MKLFSSLLVAFSCVCLLSEGSELITAEQREALTNLSVDATYLQSFPFEKYWVTDAPLQGKFYIDTLNDTIKNQLARRIPWEPQTDQLIYRYTKPGTVALDIGAHIGTHTLALSKAVGPNGLVIAFEPQTKIFRELCMNLQLNGCTNVIPVRCALGDKNGQVGMETPVACNEGGTYVGTGKDLVALKRLDDFSLEHISFIKMDVENFEDFVLAGAFKTLQKSRPIIFLEIQGNNEQLQAAGGTRAEKTRVTLALLEKMHYRVSLFTGVDYLAIPTDL